nr:hypothetical protein Q903MT_gene2317 [Picea sitchensis]
MMMMSQMMIMNQMIPPIRILKQHYILLLSLGVFGTSLCFSELSMLNLSLKTIFDISC